MLKKITKILFLLIIVISMSGCNSSYRNLNDMAIVSSFLVDKEDDKYKVYIELYKEEKSENKSKKVSYFVSGKGKNLREAITNASNTVSKTLYFNHINTVIFSKKSIDNNLEYMFNYLEKRIQVNSNYYILISDDIEGLMKSEDEDNPILGEKVKYLINNSTNKGTMVNYDYLEKLSNYVSNNKDIFFNKIIIKDKNVAIENGYYFSGDKIVGELNDDEMKLINLFKYDENTYFSFDYEDNNYYVLKIDECDVNYNFKNGINIKLDIKANIDAAGSDINLKNINTIDKLSIHAKYSLERRLNELIERLVKDKSDILGINSYIYKFKGYKKYDFFNEKTNIKVNLTINKKGLINFKSFFVY